MLDYLLLPLIGLVDPNAEAGVCHIARMLKTILRDRVDTGSDHVKSTVLRIAVPEAPTFVGYIVALQRMREGLSDDAVAQCTILQESIYQYRATEHSSRVA